MRTLALTGLLTAAALVAAAGCGSSEKATSGDGATVSPAPAQTELMITLKKSPKAEPVTWTLTCDPAGGTHPAAEKACEQLGGVPADVWKPTAAGQACTDIYGGPEQGEVTGTWKGQPVEATFSRKDGCELDRWTKVGDLFGKLPRVR
ncbi:SSI family serine proteinase inhibitor [Actinocorallia longicatena]